MGPAHINNTNLGDIASPLVLTPGQSHTIYTQLWPTLPLGSGLCRNDDPRPTEEEIYGTFLKHTPPGFEDEFRDLYRRLHGGPFAFPETEVSNEPDK